MEAAPETYRERSYAPGLAVSEAMSLVFLGFLIAIVLTLVSFIPPLGAWGGGGAPASPWTFPLILAAAELCASIAGFRTLKMRLCEVWRWPRCPPSFWGFVMLAPLAALAALAAQSGFFWWMGTVHPDWLGPARCGPYPGFWAGLGMTALMVPAEELFFRGVIWEGLSRRSGNVAGVGVSAALYSGSGFGPLCVPVGLLLGALLGIVQRRSRSVLPCILSSILYNALVHALIWWGDRLPHLPR